jgi:hypothetical protein
MARKPRRKRPPARCDAVLLKVMAIFRRSYGRWPYPAAEMHEARAVLRSAWCSVTYGHAPAPSVLLSRSEDDADAVRSEDEARPPPRLH